MPNNFVRSQWAVVIAFALAANSSVFGQFSMGGLPSFSSAEPPGLDQLKELDPTNKNSEVSKDLKHAEEVVNKQIDSAFGGRFTVTIRNPTSKVVFYTFNGEKQIGLPADYQRTHRGVGKAEIRFDRGLGDDSVFDYNLSSGKTYHFRWIMTDLPEVGKVSMLNLYGDASPDRPTGPATNGLANGAIVRLQCLGQVEGPRWLDGNTIAGTVRLAPSPDGLSGARWRVITTDHGDTFLECLGDVNGPRWLDGNTVAGSVQLAPRTSGLSGTRWQVFAADQGAVYVRCMGNVEGPRWLDGNTIKGSVHLAPQHSSQTSGTRWRIHKE